MFANDKILSSHLHEVVLSIQLYMVGFDNSHSSQICKPDQIIHLPDLSLPGKMTNYV